MTKPEWSIYQAAVALLQYAQLEEEYSRVCDRRRTDWAPSDLDTFRERFGVPDSEPIGAFLSRMRRAAIDSTS